MNGEYSNAKKPNATENVSILPTVERGRGRVSELIKFIWKCFITILIQILFTQLSCFFLWQCWCWKGSVVGAENGWGRDLGRQRCPQPGHISGGAPRDVWQATTFPHHRVKVCVLHGFHGSQSLLMVVPEKFIQEVKSFWRHQMLIFAVYEPLPSLPTVPAQYVGESGVQFYLIFSQVFIKFFGTQNLSDPDKLIVVIMTMEERFFPKDHGSQHAPQTPHIQAVVIHLIVHQ